MWQCQILSEKHEKVFNRQLQEKGSPTPRACHSYLGWSRNRVPSCLQHQVLSLRVLISLCSLYVRWHPWFSICFSLLNSSPSIRLISCVSYDLLEFQICINNFLKIVTHLLYHIISNKIMLFSQCAFLPISLK